MLPSFWQNHIPYIVIIHNPCATFVWFAGIFLNIRVFDRCLIGRICTHSHDDHPPPRVIAINPTSFPAQPYHTSFSEGQITSWLRHELPKAIWFHPTHLTSQNWMVRFTRHPCFLAQKKQCFSLEIFQRTPHPGPKGPPWRLVGPRCFVVVREAAAGGQTGSYSAWVVRSQGGWWIAAGQKGEKYGCGVRKLDIWHMVYYVLFADPIYMVWGCLRLDGMYFSTWIPRMLGMG